MKLIINASSVYKGGAEQVVVSFINECIRLTENEYHVFLRDNIGSQLDPKHFPENFTFYPLKQRPGSGFKNYLKTVRYFNSLEKKIKPDCVISTGGHGYWRPRAPLLAGFNIPHYIYPESPYFARLSYRRKLYWKVMKKIHLFFYNRADAFVVQTEDVNRRLKELFKNKPVYTVSNTVNSYFVDPKPAGRKLPEKKKDEIRLLTLSSYYPHKNIEIIRDVIDVFLKKEILNYRFVLTLPDEIFKNKFEEKYRPYIYNTGPVPIKECPSLYSECDFMLLPTLLECFSASYAEAMIMEKPILTSDLGFAHTVCGDGAIYFNPLDPDDIAEKTLSLSQSREQQKNLIAAGKTKLKNFSTSQERAMQFLLICKELTANGEKN